MDITTLLQGVLKLLPYVSPLYLLLIIYIIFSNLRFKKR